MTKALASSYDVTSSSFKAALDPGGPLFEVLIGEAEISLDGEDQIMVRDVMVHGGTTGDRAGSRRALR